MKIITGTIALALIGGLAAQSRIGSLATPVQIDVRAQTGVGCRLNQAVKSVPKGTNLSMGFASELRSGSSHSGIKGVATPFSYLIHGAGTTYTNFIGGTSRGQPKPESCIFDLSIRSTAGTVGGQLRIEVFGKARSVRNDFVRVAGTVTVGARSVKWSDYPSRPKQVLLLPMTLTTTGIRVKVECDAVHSAVIRAEYQLDVLVAFELTPCTVTSYGTSCTPQKLSFPDPRTLMIDFGTLRFGYQAALIGIKKANTPLPWPGCNLLVVPLTQTPPVVSGGTLRLRIPSGKYTVLLQSMWSNGFTVRTGPGIELRCAR